MYNDSLEDNGGWEKMIMPLLFTSVSTYPGLSHPSGRLPQRVWLHGGDLRCPRQVLVLDPAAMP